MLTTVHPTLKDHVYDMRPTCVVHVVWRYFIPEPSTPFFQVLWSVLWLCHQLVTDVTAWLINPNPSCSKKRKKKKKKVKWKEKIKMKSTVNDLDTLVTKTNDYTSSKSLNMDIKWEVHKRTQQGVSAKLESYIYKVHMVHATNNYACSYIHLIPYSRLPCCIHVPWHYLSRFFHHILGLWHHIMWHVMWLWCHMPLHCSKEKEKKRKSI